MSSALLTTKQASSLLGISTRTLKRWEAKKIISSIRTHGKHRRYSLEQIEQIRNPVRSNTFKADMVDNIKSTPNKIQSKSNQLNTIDYITSGFLSICIILFSLFTADILSINKLQLNSTNRPLYENLSSFINDLTGSNNNNNSLVSNRNISGIDGNNKNEESDVLALSNTNTSNNNQINFDENISLTATNLINNSSFEANSSGKPLGWNYIFNSTLGNTFLSREGIHSGKLGLKIDGGPDTPFGISQPDTKTTPGRIYTLSLYIKNTNTRSAIIRFGFWDEFNNRESHMSEYSITGTRDWRRISMTITTPGQITDHANLYPMIQIHDLDVGSIYIDNIQLEEGSILTSYKSATSKPSSLEIGDGAIFFSPQGHVYPAYDDFGSLGLSTNRYQELRLINATINKEGGISAKSSALSDTLTVDGITTLKSTLILRGISYLWPLSQGLANTYLKNDGGGNLSWEAISTFSISPDSLDFTDFKDSMTLDDNLSISSSASNYSINIDSGTLFVDTANNRIGIGDTSPSNKLSVSGNANLTGHLAIGANSAVDDGALFYSGNTFSNLLSLQETFTNLSTKDYYQGITNFINLNPSANSSAIITNEHSETRVQSGNTRDFTNYIAANELRFKHYGSGTISDAYTILGDTSNYSSGTISTATGGYFSVNNQGTGTISNAVASYLWITSPASGSTITNGYALYIATPSKHASATFTNNYGIYIANQQVSGITNTFNLYSDGTGKNYFGGNVGIGTTAPTSLLSLSGQAARSIQTERHTTDNTAGNNLTLKVGGTKSGATDKNGGNLILSGGISTGTGTSQILFQTATAGTTGTSDNAPSTKMTILGNGNVGIGTTAPGAILDVNGTLLLSGATASRDYLFTGNPENQLVLQEQTSGQVNYLNLYAKDGDGTDSIGFQVWGVSNISSSTNRERMLMQWNSSTSTYQIITESNGTGVARPLHLYTQGNSAGHLYLSTGGNVGIGNTNPSDKLYVGGDTQIVNNSLSALRIGSNAGLAKFQFDTITPKLYFLPTAADSGTTTRNSPTLDIRGAYWNGSSSTQVAFTLQNIVSSTTPNYRLGIANNGGTEVVSLTGTGNVGIGATAPVYLLDVAKDIGTYSPTAFNAAQLNIDNTTAQANSAAAIRFRTQHSNNAVNYAYIGIVASSTGGGDIFFAQRAGASAVERMRIATGGNVGINTTSPTYQLSTVSSLSTAGGAVAALTNTNTTDSANTVTLRLNTGATATTTNARFITFYAGCTTENCAGTAVGNLKLNNNAVQLNSGAADFAERFPVSESTEQGDIIGVNQHGNRKARTGDGLLGVISDTAIVVGNTQDNIDVSKNPIVGLLGQIYTKVSNENGAIKPGDSITISSVPGVGMKSNKPTSIIGRALESYDSDKIGKIKVYVNSSYSDPLNALSNISFDLNGNIILPNIDIENEITSLGGIANNENKNSSPEKDLDWTLTDIVRRILKLEKQNENYQDQLASNSAKLESITQIINQERSNTHALSSNLYNLESKISSIEADLLLFATNSNTLNLNATESGTLNLDNIDSNSISITKSLNVGGRTVLSDVGITGNLNVGLLNISGLDSMNDSYINTTAGLLKLQSDGYNGIDFLNGKILFETDGNVKIKGEIKTNKININIDNIASASLGSDEIKQGDTKIIINTNLITADSKIFTSLETVTDIPLIITNKIPNESFTVEIIRPTDKTLKFSWWIIN